MRIVSLLASATEILAELSLADQIVGISHECDHPPEVLGRPRVSRPRFDPAGLSSGELDRAVRGAMREHGSVYEIDATLLAELRPDLILTQAVCEVCAVPASDVREVIDGLDLSCDVLSLDAHSLGDILESVERVGEAAGRAEEGRRVAGSLARRIEAVAASTANRPRVRVLAVEWLDPPFAPGHWVPEMITAAGGECLVGRSGERSRQLEWEELGGQDPDVLLVMPCGYDLEAARRDADRFADRLVGTAPRAIAGGRAFVADASAYFNRSGPRVVRGIEILAALLHPAPGAPPPDGAARWDPPDGAPAAAGPS